MPISQENKKLYPENWQEIRAEIRERAKDCCELCGVHNHAVGVRLESGEFYELFGGWQAGQFWSMTETKKFKVIKIVCTVMHLDHDPTNNGEAGNRPNLKFGCQKCHNKHDLQHRIANRKKKMLIQDELKNKKYTNKAEISNCGCFRYWFQSNTNYVSAVKKTMVFFMVNPSTASHEKDDATVRSCRRIAAFNKCTSFIILNAFAFRSPSVKELKKWLKNSDIDEIRIASDKNYKYFESVLSEIEKNSIIVFAHGNFNKADDLFSESLHFKRMCESFGFYDLKMLGTNIDGSPEHPLFKAANTKLIKLVLPKPENPERDAYLQGDYL